MITFDSDCDFDIDQAAEVGEWMSSIASHYDKQIRFVDVVFRSDKTIHELNMQHLSHDYPTDILTFDYTEDGPIEAELHIGIEEVRRNAAELGVEFVDEVHRVLAHGILHICGFADKSKEEQQRMRKAEDLMLGMRMF